MLKGRWSKSCARGRVRRGDGGAQLTREKRNGGAGGHETLTTRVFLEGGLGENTLVVDVRRG